MANLWDLIAAIGLVILLKLDWNHWFFSTYDLEIRCMTSKNNRAPLLGYIKIYALFQGHQQIQTGVTVWKHPKRVKIGYFFVLCDLEIWWIPLKNNRAPLLYYLKLCASFHSHRSIQTGVTVRKCQIQVKTDNFFCPVWPWNMRDDIEKQ